MPKPEKTSDRLSETDCSPLVVGVICGDLRV